MVILVTGANGQLGNEMRIIAKDSADKYIFTDVVNASEESIVMLKKLAGDDIKTVQSNLGHATASFTLDVYGHVSQKMRQQSADRMEEFIQKVSG